MEIELSQESIRRLADELAPRVAKIIAGIHTDDEWVRTSEAARILGISEKYMRQIKDSYPHIKNGNDSRGKLMFKKSELIKNYAK